MLDAITKDADRGTDPYFNLIHRFPLKRITSDGELDEAIGIIDDLTSREDLSSGEDAYLDVLSDLVHAYESSAHPIPPATDAELIRFFMDVREINQRELAAETGIPESTVSEILAGKRGLNKSNIGALSRCFQISPAVFNFD